jgi:hypothetical protein
MLAMLRHGIEFWPTLATCYCSHPQTIWLVEKLASRFDAMQ